MRGYVALTVKLKPIISATYLRIRRASSRRRHSKRRVGRWPRRRPSQGTVVTRMNYTYVRACLGARSSWSSRCGQIEGGRRIGRVPCPSQNYDEINEQPPSLSLLKHQQASQCASEKLCGSFSRRIPAGVVRGSYVRRRRRRRRLPPRHQHEAHACMT